MRRGTHFRTGSFAAGVALVNAIGRLADAADHHPDVDLRHEGVTVRLTDPQRRRAERARCRAGPADLRRGARLGVSADPTGVQTVQVAIDALVGAEVRPFWRAVLGYRAMGEEELVDPHRRGPSFWFQQMDAPRPQRNRIHIDV